MKKLCIIVIVFILFATPSFANDSVNSIVLNSFNKTYTNATATEWTVTKDFTRVKFSLEGEVLYAYYNNSTGEQIAITRNIKVSQLPIALSPVIKSKYTDYYLADLFEISSESETFYYATIRKENSTVILIASPSDSWRVYKKGKG